MKIKNGKSGSNKELEERIAQLEHTVGKLVDEFVKRIPEGLYVKADYLALSKMLLMVGQRCGLDTDIMQQKIKSDQNQTKHEILSLVEDSHPALAALWDTRKIEDATDDSD